jgi:hypothetical protein
MAVLMCDISEPVMVGMLKGISFWCFGGLKMDMLAVLSTVVNRWRMSFLPQ